MTVYVDELIDYPAPRSGVKSGKWCHMATDSGDIEELHRMANAIGLKRAWFQTKNGRLEHYDLTPSKRSLAIGHGAVAVRGPDLVRLCWLAFIESAEAGEP